MTHTINDHLLARFSEFVAARFGLHFPRKRWGDLARKAVAAAAQFGYDDPSSCIRWLLSAQLAKGELDTLAGCLTIGETYFFRERKSFDFLETRILPPLIDARRGTERRLRIWSAGCSSGEEPFSIAILLRRMIADLQAWNITILATDVNPAALLKARTGRYGDWSFRGIPRWVKEQYFTRNGEGRFELVDPVRRMVTFRQLNLAEDPFPSLATGTNAMDVIFCRNVLMYFEPERMAEAVERFHHALVPGGWLIVSPCETSHTLFQRFEAVSSDDVVVYRKAGGEQPLLPAVLAEPPVPQITLPHPASTAPPLPLIPPAPPRGAERETDPPCPSRYDEALALYRQGAYAAAAAKLSDGGGQGAREYGLLARIHANQGDFGTALSWAEKAISLDKLDPELRYLLAVIFQETGDEEAAIAALKRTLYLDQRFVLAHFALANLSLQKGWVKEAARHLDNAAALVGDYGDDEVLPGSEGLSARRLGEIIAATAVTQGEGGYAPRQRGNLNTPE